MLKIKAVCDRCVQELTGGRFTDIDELLAVCKKDKWNPSYRWNEDDGFKDEAGRNDRCKDCVYELEHMVL